MVYWQQETQFLCSADCSQPSILTKWYYWYPSQEVSNYCLLTPVSSLLHISMVFHPTPLSSSLSILLCLDFYVYRHFHHAVVSLRSVNRRCITVFDYKTLDDTDTISDKLINDRKQHNIKAVLSVLSVTKQKLDEEHETAWHQVSLLYEYSTCLLFVQYSRAAMGRYCHSAQARHLAVAPSFTCRVLVSVSTVG